MTDVTKDSRFPAFAMVFTIAYCIVYDDLHCVRSAGFTAELFGEHDA